MWNTKASASVTWWTQELKCNSLQNHHVNQAQRWTFQSHGRRTYRFRVAPEYMTRFSSGLASIVDKFIGCCLTGCGVLSRRRRRSRLLTRAKCTGLCFRDLYVRHNFPVNLPALQPMRMTFLTWKGVRCLRTVRLSSLGDCWDSVQSLWTLFLKIVGMR